MMRKLMFFLLILTFFIAPAPYAMANSLWTDNAPAANLFNDHRAHAIGDVITIVISESSSASRSGNASNSKSANASAKAGVGVFSGITDASTSTADNFNAKGSIDNSNKVSGRITVKITEVLPNGQMAISGTQMIKQNTEEQKITITGIIRSEDIMPDNTVLSNNVADAQLKVEGKGPLSGKQRQGILTQIFNFLF